MRWNNGGTQKWRPTVASVTDTIYRAQRPNRTPDEPFLIPATRVVFNLYVSCETGAVTGATLTRWFGSISRAHQPAGHNPISARLVPLRSV